eukprot:gene12840-3585_t
MASNQRSFTIDKDNNCFCKDGKPFRYISGSMHYFRVPRCHWNDRLMKIRAAGLNVVESYIAWHVHEQTPGQYDFSGENDIFEFIKLAQKNGLLVILRPGPFIDAERDFGGLPWWLLKKKDIKLRTSKDEFFIKAVQDWYAVLLPKLRPFVYCNGGPVVMLQIENEYGSYFACDKDYLEQLQQFYTKYLESSVILFSVDDGFRENELKCGSLPTTFRTVDFGPTKDVAHGFDILRKLQPKGPLVNTEYYTGWLDHWGEPHQKRATELVVDQLDIVLQQNASVNLYMFEGGTNFGFTNGAELMKDGEFQPEPTSYDYDAPLSEAGDPTEKYFALRKLISKYLEIPQMPVPGPTPKVAYGKVSLPKMITIFDALPYLTPDGPVKSQYPKSMEDLDQSYGFILYRTKIISSDLSNTMTIKIDALRDRSVIMVDKVLQCRLNRGDNIQAGIKSGQELDILVENQGRVNYKYGSFTSLYDPKGIIGNVTLNGEILENWEIFPLPLNNTARIPWESIETNSHDTNGIPSFYFGEFSANEVNDTFMKTSLFTKGQAFVNNFNIGRYWTPMGPQQTLFVPLSAIKKVPEMNRVMLFEVDGLIKDPTEAFIEFVDKPIWKD